MAVPKLKYTSGNSASTTLSSAIANTDTAAPLTSDTNFSAKSGEGMVIIAEGQATEEFAYATGKSGASLTIPLINRGLEGTSAEGQDNGATVKGILTAGMWNDLIDALADNVIDKDAGTLKLQGTATVTDILDEDNMASNSATAIPTQQSVKAYVDAATGIPTQLNDTNGNEAIKTVATTSAVNELTVTNAATGGSPEISATGSDTNIDVKLAAKGTGVSTMTVRRQGGSATDWSSAGTTDYTEANTFIQCGVKSTPLVSTNYTVTFPVAFADKPVVTGVVSSGNVPGFTIRSITASSFAVALTGSSNASDTFHWIAIGKRA